MNNQRPVPAYADLMTYEEFMSCVACGGFTDYDGYGYYSNGKMMYETFSFYKPLNKQKAAETGYTHIAWFNK